MAYLATGTAFLAGILLGVSFALRSIARRAQQRRRRSSRVEVDLEGKS
jgi:hypothetical protein